jgi:hypothetical protein
MFTLNNGPFHIDLIVSNNRDLRSQTGIHQTFEEIIETAWNQPTVYVLYLQMHVNNCACNFRGECSTYIEVLKVKEKNSLPRDRGFKYWLNILV